MQTIFCELQPFGLQKKLCVCSCTAITLQYELQVFCENGGIYYIFIALRMEPGSLRLAIDSVLAVQTS